MKSKNILNKAELGKIKSIRNREGDIIPFNIWKIVDAVNKAFLITKEGTEKDAENIAVKVFHKLIHIKTEKNDKKFIPTVELIQDIVEAHLMDLGFHSTAKSYILYRSKRAELRKEVGIIPAENKKIFDN